MHSLTVSLSESTARIVALLRTPEDAITIRRAPSGRGYVCTFPPAYADRLIAQLDCADRRAAQRVRNVAYGPNRQAHHRAAQVAAERAGRRDHCPHPFRDGCPDGPWVCFTCGHREPGSCTSDHGPASR